MAVVYASDIRLMGQTWPLLDATVAPEIAWRMRQMYWIYEYLIAQIGECKVLFYFLSS